MGELQTSPTRGLGRGFWEAPAEGGVQVSQPLRGLQDSLPRACSRAGGVGGTTAELGSDLRVQSPVWDFPHLLKFMGLWSSMECRLGTQILQPQFW